MGMQIFLGFLGVCIGMVIASGVVAFIITLGIVPRYAGITRTARQVRLYENCSMLERFLEISFSFIRAVFLWEYQGCWYLEFSQGSFWEAGSLLWEKW